MKRRQNILSICENSGMTLADYQEQASFNSDMHPHHFLPRAEFDKLYKPQQTKALNIEYRDGKLLVLCDRFGLSRISLYRSAFLSASKKKKDGTPARRIRGARLSSLSSQVSWQKEVEKASDTTAWQAKVSRETER